MLFMQVGNHIDIVSGKWIALDSGVGAGVDSYFEYLVKGSFLFPYPKLMQMFKGELKAPSLIIFIVNSC